MSIQLILPSSHRWHSSYPNIIRKVASSKPHRSMPYMGLLKLVPAHISHVEEKMKLTGHFTN